MPFIPTSNLKNLWSGIAKINDGFANVTVALYFWYDKTYEDTGDIYEDSIVGIKMSYAVFSTGLWYEITISNFADLRNIDGTAPFNFSTNYALISNGASPPTNFNNFSFCHGLSTLVEFYLKTDTVFPCFGMHLTADSPFCTVYVSDIRITHIATTPDTGTNDGTASITDINSNQPTLYSLDEVTWQTSSIFTGFDGGGGGAYYGVSIKDSLGNIDRKTFAIDSVNTYATRWQCTFYDLLGEYWYVDIQEYGYALDPLDITLGAEPVIINTGASDGNKFEIIRGSECKLQLVSETDYQFSDLFTDDERKFKVIISKDVTTGSITAKTTQWVGYVLPDVYREPYLTTPYIVEVSATDGLGTLKNFLYQFTDETAYSGILDQWSIINEILNKLNLWLNLKVINSLAETSAVIDFETMYNPFGTTYVNLEVYDGKDCDFILREILKPFGCRIFQQGGIFWIERIADLAEDTVNYFTDNYAGTNFSITEAESLIIQMTNYAASNETICVFQNQNQILEILPSWKNSKVILKLIENNQLIYNGDFKIIGDASPWVPPGWAEVFPSLANPNNQYFTSMRQVSPGKIGVSLETDDVDYTPTVLTDANYLVSSKQKLSYNSDIALRLSLRYYIKTIGSGTPSARLYYTLVRKTATAEWYLSIDPVTFQFVWYTTTDPDELLYRAINADSEVNQWIELQNDFYLPTTSENEYYYVKLFEVVRLSGSIHYHYVLYDYVKLELLVNDIFAEQTFEGNSFNNVSFKPENLDCYHGDATDFINNNIAYKNQLLLIDGSATAEWGDGQEPILRNLCDTIQNEHRFRTLKLTGTIFSKIFNFSRMIKDANIPYSLFMANFESHNIKKATHEVELIELINYIDGANPNPLYPDADIILSEAGDLLVLEDNTGYITLETSL